MDVGDVMDSTTGICCFLCEKTFSCTSAMYRHIRNVHKHTDSTISFMRTKSVACRLCGVNDVFMCHNSEQLREHLAAQHGIEFQVDNFVFTSEKEFDEWKKSVENSEVSYIKLRGTKRHRDSFLQEFTYNCKRSGFYRETIKGPNRKRSLKVKGSDKINTYCPSKICVHIWKEEEFDTDTVITVEYNKTHVGHSTVQVADNGNEFNYVLAELERGEYANSLTDGIRQIVGGNELRQLVTRTDLAKLANKYLAACDENGVEIQDEEETIENLIDGNSENDPILFHMSQKTGRKNDVYELNDGDFVLIVMNEKQKEMFIKYGPRFVAVDSSLVTGSNRFKLITLMVLDDKNRALPVTFVLSSRVDEPFMTFLFRSIRKTLKGSIRTKVFVSDDVETYYNAWKNVMGEVDQRLISNWHVDKTWRKKLAKVKDTRIKIQLYKQLNVLLTQKETGSFERMLSEVTRQLRDDPKTSEFGRFFHDTFVDRSKLWANCYRTKEVLAGNVPLENLHETIKHLVLAGIKVKRLDRSIVAVSTLLRDRYYERLIDVCEEKDTIATEMLNAIGRRHVTGVSSSYDNEISRKDERTWLVRCSSGDVETVVRIDKVSCDCRFVCYECRTCIHEYLCSCIDNCLNWNMCEHIHFVINSKVTEVVVTNELAKDGDLEEIVINCRPTTTEEEHFTEVGRMKGEILKRMEMAMVQIQAVQKRETLVLVEKLLQPFAVALNATLSIQEQIMPEGVEPDCNSKRDYSRKRHKRS